ncbi:MAG: hypothetical protein IJQ60_08525 [Prevotella sp.]|nr:hypothetical protein [Prevotella sp.]
MKRSRTNTSQQVFDALSISAEITILGGSLKQMFYTAQKSYEDDRKWIPCILGGYVFVKDPAGVVNGEVALSGIEWYNQTPVDGDYSTGRIVNPSQEVLDDTDTYDPETGEMTHEAAWRSVDYLISDGSNSEWCSGVPANCLIVHKNVPQMSTMTVFAVLKFVDTRTALTMRVLRHVEFSTEAYNNDEVMIKGDSGDEVLLDPLSLPDTVPAGQQIIDIPWMRTVSAQLYGSEGNIADAKACYLWLIADNTTALGWRPFTADEKLVMNITGEQTKTLSLDARMICGELRLRCYGCRRDEGDPWSSPLVYENAPFYEMQFTMTINDTWNADPVQRMGASQKPDMMSLCAYDMNIRYNGVDVPDNKRCLFLVHWWTQDLKTGTTYDMGWGPNLLFVPANYGFDYLDGFVTFADVLCYSHHAIVKSGNDVVTQDEKIVISPVYE